LALAPQVEPASFISKLMLGPFTSTNRCFKQNNCLYSDSHIITNHHCWLTPL